MARDFKKVTAKSAEVAVNVNRYKCAAYGCPLPGGITDSVHGSDIWYCRHHFHAKKNLWQEITQKLRRNIT
jgi:hypothetical protein